MVFNVFICLWYILIINQNDTFRTFECHLCYSSKLLLTRSVPELHVYILTVAAYLFFLAVKTNRIDNSPRSRVDFFYLFVFTKLLKKCRFANVGISYQNDFTIIFCFHIIIII